SSKATPLSLPRCRSSKTVWTSPVARPARASRAVPASRTCHPSSSRLTRQRRRIEASSSTTRMVSPGGVNEPPILRESGAESAENGRRTHGQRSAVYFLEMRNEPLLAPERFERRDPLPRPTPQFRRRAWLIFQRALDPLAPVKPLRPPRQH